MNEVELIRTLQNMIKRMKVLIRKYLVENNLQQYINPLRF